MEKIRSRALDLLGTIGQISDWVAFAITAALVGAFALVGATMGHIAFNDVLDHYFKAMFGVAVLLAVSIRAATLSSRFR